MNCLVRAKGVGGVRVNKVRFPIWSNVVAERAANGDDVLVPVVNAAAVLISDERAAIEVRIDAAAAQTLREASIPVAATILMLLPNREGW